jgi:hypothetical protein
MVGLGLRDIFFAVLASSDGLSPALDRSTEYVTVATLLVDAQR